MISSSTFEAFGKPNIGQGDPPETGLNLDLFAALFSIPVTVPHAAVKEDEVLPAGWPELKTDSGFEGPTAFLPQIDSHESTDFFRNFANGQAKEPTTPKNRQFGDVPVGHGLFFDKNQQVSAIPVKLDLRPFQTKADKGIKLPPDLSPADEADILDIVRANITKPESETALFPKPAVTASDPLTLQSQSQPLFNAPPINSGTEMPFEFQSIKIQIETLVSPPSLNTRDYLPPVVNPLPINAGNAMALELHPTELPNETPVSLTYSKVGDYLSSESHLLELPDVMRISLSPSNSGDALPSASYKLEVSENIPISLPPFDEKVDLPSAVHQIQMPDEPLSLEPLVKVTDRTLSDLSKTEIPEGPKSPAPIAPVLNEGKKLKTKLPQLEIAPEQPVVPLTTKDADQMSPESRLRAKPDELPISPPPLIASVRNTDDLPAFFSKTETQLVKTPRLPEVVDQSPKSNPQAISDSLPHVFEASVAVNFGSAKTFEPAVSRDMPKLFKDVSSIVRDNSSLRTTFSGDPISDQKIVEQIRQIFSGDGGQTLDKPLAEMVKPSKQIEFTNQATEFSFGSSPKAAAKPQSAAEAPQIESKLSDKVLDQIEPHVIDLAAITQNGKEKRTLKIRLTPAGLGTVEITVIKSASGKINAHFQTESQETRQILNESLVQLRESLERSGLQVGDLDISCASFSSSGNEGRGPGPKDFGMAEQQSAETLSFDGISKSEDDNNDRLVNLRA